ncbi:MAG: DUF262 domain-containing protein [Oscillospiraceae bacterium]|nr:DUF262 domain-containing protein [Oscillospiraceae bacterium]
MKEILNEDIDEKRITDLEGYRFFIPSYQRGYRWTKNEIFALLDDIDNFSPDDDKKYCIQPLIVKKCDEGYYEVVDGQQRLTTIYIFMKIAAQKPDSPPPLFELEYETRGKNNMFLKNLSDDNHKNDSTIDFHYIGEAYDAIKRWSEIHLKSPADISQLNIKIMESVFFILYELPDGSEPISVFTKVNLGKIPLTNAELIKALLLKKDNFETKNNEELSEIQLKISIAWDRIEHGLQNDSFWYFLNAKDPGGTRIDLLFELLANKYNENSISPKQPLFPFLVFFAVLEKADNKEEFVRRLWNEVEHLYEEFCEWYNNLNKYHIIGYLIDTGTTVETIFSLIKGKRKSAATKELLKKAKEKTNTEKYKDLTKLSFDSDKSEIRRILLLFNIATLVCKSEKQYRFPFDIYKKEKWDVEHIHAIGDDTDDPDDSLGNLTLLDCHTNRIYKNKPFPEKRRIIIERESKGLFVPLCTKNIFLKAYSKEFDDMSLWNDSDKRDYIEKIEETLQAFYEGGAML